MNPTALAFELFMRDPVLATDIDILLRAGHVQRGAAKHGHDTPAGWFAAAVHAYPHEHDDPQGDLARRALTLVSQSLANGVPQ